METNAAFGDKFRAVFQRYVESIKKHGSKFDFYKVAPALDKVLEGEGLAVKSPKFFADLFEELANHKSTWRISYEQVIKPFLDILPAEWLKKMPLEVFRRHVPQKDWDKYLESGQVKKLAASVQAEITSARVRQTLVDAGIEIKNDMVRKVDIEAFLSKTADSEKFEQADKCALVMIELVKAGIEVKDGKVRKADIKAFETFLEVSAALLQGNVATVKASKPGPIGTTRSGKPVYLTLNHKEHAGFGHEDNYDAAAIHMAHSDALEGVLRTPSRVQNHFNAARSFLGNARNQHFSATKDPEKPGSGSFHYTNNAYDTSVLEHGKKLLNKGGVATGESNLVIRWVRSSPSTKATFSKASGIPVSALDDLQDSDVEQADGTELWMFKHSGKRYELIDDGAGYSVKYH